MNVTELFRRLSYEKLANLAMAADGTGTIVDDQKPKIIAHANSGLLRLYSRFLLKEADLLIQLQDHITNYHFLTKFALNGEECPGVVKYIFDKPGEPYPGDLIKVLAVVDSTGAGHVLNDIDDPDSYFTPQPSVLQVPRPVQGRMINVLYQARHPVLTYTDMDACIELPVVLEEALLSWITAAVYSGMNGQENLAKGQEQLMMFEATCAEVVERDMVNSSSSQTGCKFRDRGFV